MSLVTLAPASERVARAFEDGGAPPETAPVGAKLGPAPAGAAAVALEEPGPGALADGPPLAGNDLQPDAGV